MSFIQLKTLNTYVRFNVYNKNYKSLQTVVRDKFVLNMYVHKSCDKNALVLPTQEIFLHQKKS